MDRGCEHRFRLRGRGMIHVGSRGADSKLAPESGFGKPRGAAIFASAKSFSPGRPGQQFCAADSGGMVPGTAVDGDLGLEDSSMDGAGLDSGASTIPKVVAEPAAAGELGIEDSAEFVPSTILELGSVRVSGMLGSGKDRFENGLVLVPLRFTARSPPG
ncbi:hypothetical protein Salat_0654400 [Sesamum alatum]|uniref:Uncharacterized protein n=1 Tax=Sesamum alatum TaxID=300844 RepID=A0AAE2CUF7_9LAMI|nr:hypothetical protein Salat_0654400 [Sesamum alatum]